MHKLILIIIFIFSTASSYAVTAAKGKKPAPPVKSSSKNTTKATVSNIKNTKTVGKTVGRIPAKAAGKNGAKSTKPVAKKVAQKAKPNSRSRVSPLSPEFKGTATQRNIDEDDSDYEDSAGEKAMAVGDNVEKAIYRISLYKTGTRIKLKEGAGLAVSSEYVVVPFDLIADVLNTNKEVQIVIETEQGPANTTNAEIDIFNNIALLKVTNQKLSRFVDAGRISNRPLASGENVTLFGFVRGSGLLEHQSIVLSLLSDGLLSGFRLQGGASLNQSGFFIFDNESNFVGIVSQSQSGKWLQGFPAYSAARLLRQRTQPQPASNPNLRVSALNQYNQVQTNWVKSFVSPELSSPIVSRSWVLGSASRLFECEVTPLNFEDRTVSGKIARAEAQRCANPLQVPGEAWVPSAFETVSGTILLKSAQNDSDRLQIDSELARYWRKIFISEVSDVSSYSSSECQSSDILNSRKQKISIEYCTSALRGAVGLNDWFVKVTTWNDRGEGAFVVSRLKGFHHDSIKSLISKLSEDMRRSP